MENRIISSSLDAWFESQFVYCIQEISASPLGVDESY